MKIVTFQDEQENITILHGVKYALIKSIKIEDEQKDGSILVGYKTYLKELPSWVNDSNFNNFVTKQKKKLVKELKQKLIEGLTVTTKNGNEFDADDKSLSNMAFAIQASEVAGTTEHSWKLADNTVKTITLDELKEALTLGIKAKGAIVLSEDVDA